MELHYIADDLENHAWYEALFVEMIAEVEQYVAATADDQRPASGSGPR